MCISYTVHTLIKIFVVNAKILLNIMPNFQYKENINFEW